MSIYLVPNFSFLEDDTLGAFINHKLASEFLNEIEDPIIQSLLRSSYQTLCMSDASVDGDFDLLYFFRIMEEFLRDRKKLARSLLGDFEDEKDGWGT